MTKTLYSTLSPTALIVSLFLGCVPSLADPAYELKPIPAAGLAVNHTNTMLDLDAATKNIFMLDEANLNQGKPLETPWSDSYWPYSLGGIATRYNDPEFPGTQVWQENYDYYLSSPTESLVAQNLNHHLSPAEKYDLLVGVTEGGLTESQWDIGVSKKGINGGVKIWEGLCDGWAAAASAGVPAPKKSVTLRGVNGDVITFFESDIKALVTLMWKKFLPPIYFAGSRCWSKKITRNEEGRLTQGECFDMNPMLWHLVITHRIGKEGRGLVFDQDFGHEVWNFPIRNYEITYRDPISFDQKGSLSEAIAHRSQMESQPFFAFRNPKTEYVVGVSMKVGYPKFTIPHTGPHGVLNGEMEFHYDLELDADYNIIGGEWHSPDHPDFVWAFGDNAEIADVGADLIKGTKSWDTQRGFPTDWVEAAHALAKKNQPLPRAVKTILEASQ